MARPKAPEPQSTINLHIPTRIRELLEQECKETDRTISQLVRFILKEHVEKRDV